jgi:hypothetical protein
MSRDDPRTAYTLARFADVVRSAEMMAKGDAWATHPRDVIAKRLRLFVNTFDREQGWAPSGEYGEHGLRVRALAVADLLSAQAARARSA